MLQDTNLNVWTSAPSPAARLPVIVWVYGGGHRLGAGSHPCSWGDHLAARGCVVVTFNYRVGPLGYFAHPELTRESGSCGNYATLDIIAALQWVQRNITAFGGDPRCVTLYGQSAGAAHVNVLMASARARVAAVAGFRRRRRACHAIRRRTAGRSHLQSRRPAFLRSPCLRS